MNFTAPRAICFDLDGTLVDSVSDLTFACNLMLAERGLDSLGEETVRGYIGDGARMLVARALGEEGPEVGAALLRFREFYAQHLLDHTRAYPEVASTLSVLQARGLRMGVVSNKPDEFTTKVVEGVGLAQYFDAIVGARRGVPVKPAPDLLQLVLDQLKVDAKEAWMVGDSKNDVKAAHAVGCVSIALSYGIGRVEDLHAAKPHALLSSFGELLSLLR
jgi:phosphoglycolate phosphatase